MRRVLGEITNIEPRRELKLQQPKEELGRNRLIEDCSQRLYTLWRDLKRGPANLEYLQQLFPDCHPPDDFHPPDQFLDNGSDPSDQAPCGHGPRGGELSFLQAALRGIDVGDSEIAAHSHRTVPSCQGLCPACSDTTPQAPQLGRRVWPSRIRQSELLASAGSDDCGDEHPKQDTDSRGQRPEGRALGSPSPTRRWLCQTPTTSDWPVHSDCGCICEELQDTSKEPVEPHNQIGRNTRSTKSMDWLFAAERFRPSARSILCRIGAVERALAVDWLLQTCQAMSFPEVVAFAAISLLDRYLETLHTAIPLEQMQVVTLAVTCTALKLHGLGEVPVPLRDVLVHLGQYNVPIKQIFQKEREVLDALDFDVSAPTVMDTLGLLAFRCTTASKEMGCGLCAACGDTVWQLAEFFLHLAARKVELYYEYPPTALAAGAAYLAWCQVPNRPCHAQQRKLRRSLRTVFEDQAAQAAQAHRGVANRCHYSI
ncbi:unnamed protein product [Durusdinium trenchii]|uniref:Cyclin-like domain-containing protein n=1 Tax=Durusdinium trenchii TaxID=1381693 RepID=A0ABP0J0L3_9DINO